MSHQAIGGFFICSKHSISGIAIAYEYYNDHSKRLFRIILQANTIHKLKLIG